MKWHVKLASGGNFNKAGALNICGGKIADEIGEAGWGSDVMKCAH